MQAPITFAQLDFLEEIGRGTFGIVFKARWHRGIVAVKKIRLTRNHTEVEREYRYLSHANHRNIIFLHGTSVDNDYIYLVMEYAQDGSLHDLVYYKQVEYKLEHVINWALQIAKGVSYLHSMSPQVIHRDLKPLNILLDDNHRHVKICDFGAARIRATMMTKDRGTARYMAPEVFQGQCYTEKCDIYSLAITLWEILSRKLPYHELTDDLTVCQHVDKGKRPSLDDIKFDCPENIRKLVMDCWQTDPAGRRSIEQFIEVLSDYSIDYESLIL